MINLHNTIDLDFKPVCPITTILIVVLSTSLFLSGCNGGGAPSYTYENAAQSESGLKYVFFTHNKKNRPVTPGDFLTFQLLVQNHQDSVLSNRTFQEFPFQEPYFISKPYYKDIFSIVYKGDSLCFWIPADSLANKSGGLNSPKIPPGSLIKYTLKVLDIKSQEDIRNKIEKEDLKVQREEDLNLIQNYTQANLDTSKSVLKTKSGIHYFFDREGQGQFPQEGDTVRIKYIGKLLDGTIYDQSVETTEFLLDNLDPDGLKESIALMKVGSKGTFILPSELAFGLKGMGSVIPPNTVLVFDVELIEIK